MAIRRKRLRRGYGLATEILGVVGVAAILSTRVL